ncbi:hypothetical protein [Robertmurraya andreesenii]|uniref:Uncharacterized protein n=1 Tax=Anoxybacillus andreesenii TaxID=1325932 RepID=A0ABT9V436_9BACL|nr:hypothetical protein [Robertmurraya andreesenii]MDQ0155709.1 hypothetical protein [Robertmurraya andreesenii]
MYISTVIKLVEWFLLERKKVASGHQTGRMIPIRAEKGSQWESNRQNGSRPSGER